MGAGGLGWERGSRESGRGWRQKCGAGGLKMAWAWWGFSRCKCVWHRGTVAPWEGGWELGSAGKFVAEDCCCLSLGPGDWVEA